MIRKMQTGGATDMEKDPRYKMLMDKLDSARDKGDTDAIREIESDLAKEFGVGMMGGGSVMQYAQGGAVQRLQEGGEPEPQDFPRRDGPINGAGTETSDDIPAMLSDGEFVMTAAENKGLGGFKIEKNKDSLTIFPTGKPDREQGFKNNDKLMKFFEDYQEMMS